MLCSTSTVRICSPSIRPLTESDHFRETWREGWSREGLELFEMAETDGILLLITWLWQWKPRFLSSWTLHSLLARSTPASHTTPLHSTVTQIPTSTLPKVQSRAVLLLKTTFFKTTTCHPVSVCRPFCICIKNWRVVTIFEQCRFLAS